MPHRYFCTYFDSHYLLRGLILYRSLQQHVPAFTLWALCLDEVAFDALTRLSWPGLQPIRLADFESGDYELATAKNNRSRIEYYFTCTSSLPLYILRQQPQIEIITYLDADLRFYAQLTPIYEELGDNSVLIVSHRFPPELQERNQYGIYNVGWLTFRNDAIGHACLGWWRERCLEWCYDRVENGKFADQKYLDDWPKRFAGVCVLQHPGAGLAPWNWMNYSLQLINGQLIVDRQPLIFYHFHGLRVFSRWLSDPGLANYKAKMPRPIRNWLYGGYLRAWREIWEGVRHIPAIVPGYSPLSSRSGGRRAFIRRLLTGQLLIHGV